MTEALKQQYVTQQNIILREAVMKSGFIFIPLILFFLTGCSTLNYRIGFPPDADPSSFTKYEVKEIKIISGSISYAAFGPYEVNLSRSGIDKSEKKSDSLFSYEERRTASEKYTYSLNAGKAGAWSGGCESSADYYVKETGFSIFRKVKEGHFKNRLHCGFTSPKSFPHELKIEVNETPDEPDYISGRGYIRKGDIKLDIERTSNTENLSLVPLNVGYYIYHNGSLVAAVQNMIHGAVYISKTLEPELLPIIVNASAAILTYYNLELEVLPDSDEES